MATGIGKLGAHQNQCTMPKFIEVPTPDGANVKINVDHICYFRVAKGDIKSENGVLIQQNVIRIFLSNQSAVDTTIYYKEVSDLIDAALAN